MKQKSFNIILVCFLNYIISALSLNPINIVNNGLNNSLVYEACKDSVPNQACFDCRDPVMNQFCQLTCNTCVVINGTNQSVSASSIPFGQPKSGLKYLISYNDSQECFFGLNMSSINNDIIRCNSIDWIEFFLVDVPSTISPTTDKVLTVFLESAESFPPDNAFYRDKTVTFRQPYVYLFSYNVNLVSNVDVLSLNFSINNCSCLQNDLLVSVYLLVSQDNKFDGIHYKMNAGIQNYLKSSSSLLFKMFFLHQGYNSIDLMNLLNKDVNLVNYIGIIVQTIHSTFCQVNQQNIVLDISYKKAFKGAVSFQSTHNNNKYLRHSENVIKLHNFLPSDYAGDRSFYAHQKDLYLSLQSAHPFYFSFYIGKHYDQFEIRNDANIPAFTLVVIDLLIESIVSINRYAVNITINSSTLVSSLTTNFKIKCKDPNNVISLNNSVTDYTAVISSLQSYTWYNFSAGLKNEFGFYVYGRVFTFHTDEDVPAGYPRNFTVEKVNFTTLFLSWAQVESSMRKGIILNYIYSCNNTEDSFSNTVDNSTFNVTLYNLNPDEIYNCSVAACTKVGCGLQAFVSNNTLVGIPSGPPLNFTVRPLGFSSLLLSWDRVEYLKTNGTIIAYNYSCSNKKNTWNIVDNNTFQLTVENLTYNTTYNCSITACTRVGCGVQSSSLNTTLDGSPEESATITYINQINSSSIYVSWNDITLSKWGKQEYRSFCLDVGNRTHIVKTQCFEYGIENAQISGLAPYTNYTVLVYCKNIVGIGFKDSNKKKSVLTDELSPLISPKNVSVISNNANSILVRWKPLDPNEYTGVLKGYSILVKAVYSESDFKLKSKRKRRDNLDRQIYNGSFLLELETNISDPNATFFNITNLFGNTIYIINISANTKYQGVYSSGFQTKTKEGVPLVSAVNLRCDVVRHDSINIRWELPPQGYLQGNLTGYNLFYQKVSNITNTNSPSIDVLTADTTLYKLVNIHAFADYNIVLTAFTKDGGGANSQLKCKGGPTVPRQSPRNLTATSYHYPNKTNVSWIDIPKEDWRGIPLGYTIAYKLLQQGSVNIFNQSWQFLNISYTNQSEYQLEGLQVYSRYSLKIAGYNSIGIGPYSDVTNLDTCRILDPVIQISYISLPPFTKSETLMRPSGVMIASTEKSLKTCAGACMSFTRDISFTYTDVKKSSLEFVKMISNTIKLPVTVPAQVLNSSFASTLQLPGFVLVFIPSNKYAKLSENEKMVFKNISTSLATLVIYVLLNCLFGAILFYCQNKSHRKGHCFTLSGIFEEIYFSIITITTVGFGDKIPSTFYGRVLVIIWTFMGIVLTSICVGNIISALTVDVVSSTIYLYPKENVIAKLGSPEHIWANKISSINLTRDKNYTSHSDIFDGLEKGQAKYAIFDPYTILAYPDVFKRLDIKISKVLKTNNVYYGVSLGGNYSVLQSCINGLLKDSSAMVHSAMNDFKVENAQQNNSNHLNVTSSSVQLFSIESPIFRNILFGMAGTLLGLFIAGGVYEILRIKWNKKSRVSPSLDEKLAYLRDMKDLSEEYLTEFQKMIGRLQVKTDLLFYKHAEQRFKLRNKFSKLYGVNFKYVNLNDLGVSLEQIAEFREEIKRRPKKTRWQRFSEYTVKKLTWLRIKLFT